MYKFDEQALREGIRIGLGSQGIWTPELEDVMFNEITDEALRKTDVNRTLLEEIRQAFADYYESEGCSCCEDTEPHKEANLRLGKLLGAEMRDDNSGVNWYKYRSKKCP